MAFIEIEGYSFAYPRAGKKPMREGDASKPSGVEGEACCDADGSWVLRNLDLQVEEGDFCVIVGSTGCGKTTLLRSLKPELSPAGVRTGTVRIAGHTLVEDGKVSHGLSSRESASSIG